MNFTYEIQDILNIGIEITTEKNKHRLLMEKQNLMQKILPLGVKLPATIFVHAEAVRSISIVTVKYKVKACITAHLEQFYGEVKNSRRSIYAKIFNSPRNYSI